MDECIYFKSDAALITLEKGRVVAGASIPFDFHGSSVWRDCGELDVIPLVKRGFLESAYIALFILAK